MRDGQHLISGGSDGLVNIFNAAFSKEDQALQSTCSVCCHFHFQTYLVSHRLSPLRLALRLIALVLCRNVSCMLAPMTTNAQCFFRMLPTTWTTCSCEYVPPFSLLSNLTPVYRRNGTEGRFLVDALKGGVDERPVALVECDAEGTVSFHLVVFCAVIREYGSGVLGGSL